VNPGWGRPRRTNSRCQGQTISHRHDGADGGSLKLTGTETVLEVGGVRYARRCWALARGGIGRRSFRLAHWLWRICGGRRARRTYGVCGTGPWVSKAPFDRFRCAGGAGGPSTLLGQLKDPAGAGDFPWAITGPDCACLNGTDASITGWRVVPVRSAARREGGIDRLRTAETRLNSGAQHHRRRRILEVAGGESRNPLRNSG